MDPRLDPDLAHELAQGYADLIRQVDEHHHAMRAALKLQGERLLRAAGGPTRPEAPRPWWLPREPEEPEREQAPPLKPEHREADPGAEELPNYAGWINSNEAPDPAPWPADAKGSWKGNGRTLWGLRWYNAEGELGPIELLEIGDFLEGREGHAVYANVLGPSTRIVGLRAIRCGGQALQAVWRGDRPGKPYWQRETALPGWDTPAGVPLPADSFLTVQNLEAIECGQIRTGSAPRASWPVSLFSPAMNLALEAPIITTIERPALGGILIRPGQAPRYGKSIGIGGGKQELKQSDRAPLHLGGYREVGITEHAIRSTRPQSRKGDRIVLENDIQEATLDSLDWSGIVEVVDHRDPHRQAIREIRYARGQVLELEPSRVR